uniref:Aminopeptidase n=1 Tax=Eptatretus burgeri TaxID=7764 RepID=A0A8C4QX74_EPTBU
MSDVAIGLHHTGATDDILHDAQQHSVPNSPGLSRLPVYGLDLDELEEDEEDEDSSRRLLGTAFLYRMDDEPGAMRNSDLAEIRNARTVAGINGFPACTLRRAIATVFLFALAVVAVTVLAYKVQRPCNSGDDCHPNPRPSPTSSVRQQIADFTWSNNRLPRFVQPEIYTLHLHPNITSETFSGQMRVTLMISEPTSYVVFHGMGINILSAALGGGNLSLPSSILTNSTLQQHALLLPELLQPDHRYELSLNFSGNFSHNLKGLYRSTTRNEYGTLKYLAVTQFEPTYARMVFPCFDEPAFKANFSLSLVRENRHVALANMPLVKSEPLPGELTKDYFQTTVKMSSYLLAFAIGEFESISKETQSGVNVSIFAVPGKAQHGKFALDDAVRVLEYYELGFAIPYPLQKLDLLAVPDFEAGAMENWGLVIFKERNLLLSPGNTNAFSIVSVSRTVTHELAHQWFGNLVTMGWWNDLWLNEGFATLMEVIATDFLHSNWDLKSQNALNNMLSAMEKDSLQSTHPISANVHNISKVEEMFDSLSYQKAAAVLGMLRFYLKVQPFDKGVQFYLKNNSYGNADVEDLWRAISQRAENNSDVIKMMDLWIRQPGFPLITATRNGKNVKLHQNRFFLNYPGAPGTKSALWNIPLNLLTSKKLDSDFDFHLMVNREDELPIGDVTWFLLDEAHCGFYLVNYDVANWNALQKQLMEDHTVFGSSQRAVLLHSAFMLAYSGILNYSVPLSLTRYLPAETSFVPWHSALRNLGVLNDLLAFYGAESHNLQKYILNISTPIFNTSFSWNSSETVLQRLLQEYSFPLLCRYGSENATEKALSLYSNWKLYNASVPADVLVAVYTEAIRSVPGTFDFLLNRYRNESNSSERYNLLHALASTPNATQRQWYGFDANGDPVFGIGLR